MLFPVCFDDLEAEYWHLIGHVTVWDVSVERQVEITGRDAFAFVNRLTPRDLTRCAVGQGKYVLITAGDGGIINDPVLLRLGENHFWLALADSDVLLWARGVALDAGLDVRILSGDRASAVAPVAAALGVTNWLGGLKPADKIARIEELKRRGTKVLMVGDGMNDAPALAAAHVSMSPVSATHLSQATADLVFLGDRLAPVVSAIGFARKALRLMRQNLWLAAGYNLFAVPLAIAGLATPLVAAAAMSGSSLLVILNALRAHRGTRELG